MKITDFDVENGQKLRISCWNKDRYIYCSDRYDFVDQDGNIFVLDPGDILSDKWELYTHESVILIQKIKEKCQKYTSKKWHDYFTSDDFILGVNFIAKDILNIIEGQNQ